MHGSCAAALLALMLRGVRENGDPKLRPIDDFSRSGCNSTVDIEEKLEYETLDNFVEALRLAKEKLGPELEMWKAGCSLGCPSRARMRAAGMTGRCG